MNPIHRYIPALAVTISLLVLLTALGFQYLGDIRPCKLCLWQRWPHALVIIPLIGWIVRPASFWLLVGGLLMLIGSLLGGYHWGVENQWWVGLASCSGSQLNSDELVIDFLSPVSVPRCDEVVWSFLGLSMAGWNMIISLALAFLWLYAFSQKYSTNCKISDQ